MGPGQGRPSGHADTEQMPLLATGPETAPWPAPGPSTGPQARAAVPSRDLYRVPRAHVLAALEQCVNVVGPEDTLIVRVPSFLTREQVSGYQRSVDELLRHHHVSNHVLILPGEEFATIRRPSAGREDGEPG